jgi:putative spermidine/putrescine transport system substrate-binding protein/spermidine/putrescine transport system substrate-binding protein
VILSLALVITALFGDLARQPVPAVSAAGTLNVLTWEGYANAQWVRPLEQKYGVKVNVTYIGSDDELFAKMRGGQGMTYDVVATNRANLPAFKASNLIVPLDESKVPNYHNVILRLKDKAYRLGGRLYAVPFLWGANVLLYNPEYVKSAPTSWNVLWDKTYAGHITMADDSTLSTCFAALARGYKDPFHLSDAQLDAVKNKRSAQRPLLRTYVTGFQDDANMFASGAMVGVSEGSYVVKLAAQKGLKLVEAVPREGAISWLDT